MKKPLKHQQEALEAIGRGLSKYPRGKVLMASGTGKSLTAWWAARTHAKRSILALVPSLALARQLYNDWRADDVWNNGVAYRWLVVCSDPSVTREGDDLDDISYAELKAEIKDVTNSPSEVRSFLVVEDPRPLVVISTYQSVPVLSAAIPKKFAFDLSIFDEAHKTAGASGKLFSLALSDKHVRSKKRLFFTATPRRSNYKKLKGKTAEIFHMDDPTVYGRTFYELSFMAALERGLVADYDVLIPVIDRAEVTREEILSEDSVALLAKTIVVAKAARKYAIKKIFSFHGTNRDSAMARNFYDAHAKEFSTYRVSGEQPAKERENILQHFAAASRSIVTNARCLGEGVNIPACDAVAFLTPRRSKVDVVQAVGRACRIDRQTGATKQKAYVVIPIFIEAGETLEEAKDRSAFRDAFDTLHALREHNVALSDEIRAIREHLRNPEAARPPSLDEARIKILTDQILQGEIAGVPVAEFEHAFQVLVSRELRATTSENKRTILEFARKEARRLGRLPTEEK
jgi:predicted helicase